MDQIHLTEQMQHGSGIVQVGAKGQEYGAHGDNYNTKLGGAAAAMNDQIGKEYVEPPPHPLWHWSEFQKWSLWRAAIAEFVATLLFVYIGVSACIGNERERPEGVGHLGIAWSFGATIFVLAYCTAGVSGGHINPAVTFGLLLGRRISIPRAVLYVVAQVLGSLSGAGLVKAMQKGPFQRYGGGTNFVNREFSITTGLAAEIIGTFVLVYVVYSATDAKRRARDSHVPVLAPLPIGLAVFVVHLATIPITGTGINPARSFGPAALWGHKLAWDDQWIFWVGPFIGAALAAAYHQFIIRSMPLGSHFLFPSVPILARKPMPSDAVEHYQHTRHKAFG